MMKIFFALSSFLFFSNTVYADSLKPKQLLEEMCAAMSSQSYSGTFVHLHNNKIESMEIVRRKDDAGEVEKLLSLNGEAREIIRNQDVVTCISVSYTHLTLPTTPYV